MITIHYITERLCQERLISLLYIIDPSLYLFQFTQRKESQEYYSQFFTHENGASTSFTNDEHIDNLIEIELEIDDNSSDDDTFQLCNTQVYACIIKI